MEPLCDPLREFAMEPTDDGGLELFAEPGIEPGWESPPSSDFLGAMIDNENRGVGPFATESAKLSTLGSHPSAGIELLES